MRLNNLSAPFWFVIVAVMALGLLAFLGSTTPPAQLQAAKDQISTTNPPVVKWVYPFAPLPDTHLLASTTGGISSPALTPDGTIYVTGRCLFALTPQGTLKWQSSPLPQ